MSNPRFNRCTRRRRGLGLFELLISLSITAVLLTATGAALDASFKAYRTNQEIGDLTQRARLAMNRILTEIRSSQNHTPGNDVLAIYKSGVVVDTKTIRIYTDDNNAVEYHHSGTSLMRQTFTNVGGVWTAGAERAFLTGLAASEFSITMEPQRSATAARAGLPCDQLRRATVRFTIRENSTTAQSTEKSGNQSVTLASSVVPRRNAW